MVQYSLRMDEEVATELMKLSELLDVSRNALLNMLIRQEYNKYDSDPKIKLALNQIGEFRRILEKFQSETKQLV